MGGPPLAFRHLHPPFVTRLFCALSVRDVRRPAWLLVRRIAEGTARPSKNLSRSWHGRNHHNFNEHPRSPKTGREASPRRRVCRINPIVPNRIVIFEQTHVSDPDLGAQ